MREVPKQMPHEDSFDEAIIASWLAQFESSLNSPDPIAVSKLLGAKVEWRDILAITGDYTTVVGNDDVVKQLCRSERSSITNTSIDSRRRPPHLSTYGGEEVILAHFSFDADWGRGSGVLRLFPSDHPESHRAAAFSTVLDEIAGHPELRGKNRPHNTGYSRSFGGKNWLDDRAAEQEFIDRDPTVLVVGGGQAGLSIAARLKVLGIDTLVVDALPRIGDVWRRRYHSLTLHNQAWAASLPYLEFPDSWCTFIPKDKLANWFEFYADAMELNVWTQTEFISATRNDDLNSWTVEVNRAGAMRTLRPQHIVMCTGSVSGTPNLPELPGLGTFQGEVFHSSKYTSGTTFQNKRVLVVGTGTSAHDVAQDLHSLGAEVTIMQRNPTTIVSLEPSAQMVYGVYSLGLPLEEADLIAAASTYPSLIRTNQLLTQEMLAHDADLLKRLEAVGFRMDIGEDNTGFHLKYNRRGGGYYINVGCSDLIADRKIRLVHHHEIATFTLRGLQLSGDEEIPLDAVILATGYRNQQDDIRAMFGSEIADAVGPVWGVGDDGEIRNVWRRTAQPGLWFNAGSLAACRINSKYLALTIKCDIEGIDLVPAR